MDFVDCMVLSARHATSNIGDNSIVLFETALSMYLGHECSDILPPKFASSDMTCDDLIDKDVIVACQDNVNYCQLSCYQCATESNIFGMNVRGSNNELKENSVRKVYDESNIHKHKALLAPSHSKKDSKTIEKKRYKPKEDRMIRRLLDDEIEEDAVTEEEEEEESKSKVFHNLGTMKSSDTNEETSCNIANKELHTNSNRFLLISDAHLEPWYDVSGSGEVARFDDVACTVENMFECHDSSSNEELGTSVSCVLNGESDPPVSMLDTALAALDHVCFVLFYMFFLRICAFVTFCLKWFHFCLFGFDSV